MVVRMLKPRARARGNGLHHFHRNKQRQNGGRFKFRGMCFISRGQAENKTAKVFTLNTALKGACHLYIFFNKETISATIVNFLVEFKSS